MSTLIAHLDADCFYVSAERVRDLALRNIPAGVLGNQGACVIAKSYEAKAKGVKTGMPIWEAVKACPEGVYLKRDFRWYEVLSRKLLDLLRSVSPQVEYYSIDEMFFSADELEGVFSVPLATAAKALQMRILEEIKIPVSLGISHNKTLAKLVSDTAKPFGCRLLISPDDVKEFLQVHPASELTGIGSRSTAKLGSLGINTCWEYAQTDRIMIRNMLTIKGEAIWWELHREQIQKLHTSRPPHKCLGRGGSLGESTTSISRLTGWTARNIERLIEELDFHHLLTGNLVYGVEFREGGAWLGKVNFMEPTAAFLDLMSAAKALLVQACNLGRPINRMQIMAEKLSPRSCYQKGLWSNTEPEKHSLISTVKAEINGKIGRFALRGGETAALPEIYADDASEWDICDIRGKICF